MLATGQEETKPLPDNGISSGEVDVAIRKHYPALSSEIHSAEFHTLSIDSTDITDINGYPATLYSIWLKAGESLPPRLDARPDEAVGATPLRPQSASTLERYSGFYQYADNSIVTVKQDGDHLTIQFPGQKAADALYPKTGETFAYRNVEAKVQFVDSGDGGVGSAVLLQNGARTVMPRVDAATAADALSASEQRVQDQLPSPGSEAALRRLITGIEAGMPPLKEMNPQLAGAVRNDLPKLQSRLKALGPVQSMEFVGVDPNGQDKYRVVHSGGTTEEWSIQLDSRGVIDGAMVPL